MTRGERTFIVGDVHGCLDELDRLLEKVDFDASLARLVFVGDLVGKGPDSLGVVRRARELGATTVRGNHEARVLDYMRGNAGRRRAGSEHQQIAEALPAEDARYLERTPLWHEIPEHRALVVHAGLDPARRLEEQSPDVLMTIRSLGPGGEPSKRVEDGVPWASRYDGERLVVYGHDAIRGLQLRENAIGLDSGCVYGGELTALELPEKRLHSVVASKIYCVPSARRSLVKLPVCDSREVQRRRPVLVQIGVSSSGIPQQAIVVADDEGEIHAYKNRCMHLPIPLDAGSGTIPQEEGHLVCSTHGARYRIEDGRCVDGPCQGAWLEPIRVRVERGTVVLHLRD